MSLIGVMVLVGIVDNDAPPGGVKVDFILQERKRGTPPCGAKPFCSPGRNACGRL
jgi:hypothetical protein